MLQAGTLGTSLMLALTIVCIIVLTCNVPSICMPKSSCYISFLLMHLELPNCPETVQVSAPHAEPILSSPKPSSVDLQCQCPTQDYG